MPKLEPEASDVRRQTSDIKEIHVIAGIIYSPDRSRILIAKRPDHLHQGGLWEFPGGKVSEGEPAESALRRELLEELDIELTHAEPFHEVSHHYPDKAVFLEFWSVHGFAGEPEGREGQQIAWVDITDIDQYAFPAANQAVVEMLQAANANRISSREESAP